MYFNQIIKTSNLFDRVGLYKLADVLDALIKIASKADPDRLKEIFEERTGSKFEPHPLRERGQKAIDQRNNEMIALLLHHGYVLDRSSSHIIYVRKIPIPESEDFNIYHKHPHDLNSFALSHSDTGMQGVRNFITFYKHLLKWEDYVKKQIVDEINEERMDKDISSSKDTEIEVKNLLSRLLNIFKREDYFYAKHSFTVEEEAEISQLDREQIEIKRKLMRGLYSERVLAIIDEIGSQQDSSFKEPVTNLKKVVQQDLLPE